MRDLHLASFASDLGCPTASKSRPQRHTPCKVQLRGFSNKKKRSWLFDDIEIEEGEIDYDLSTPNVRIKEENRKKGITELPAPDEFQGELHLGHNPNDALGYYYSPDDETRGANNRTRLIESVQLQVAGGKGGNGCISFEVLSPGKKRPDGGNGGRGGHVYILADRDLTSLKFTTYHYNAGSGAHGGSDGLTGARGKDVYIRVPVGTVVSEKLREEVFGDGDYDWGDDGDDDNIYGDGSEYAEEEEEEEDNEEEDNEEGDEEEHSDEESDNEESDREEKVKQKTPARAQSPVAVSNSYSYTLDKLNEREGEGEGSDPNAWANSIPISERPHVSRRQRLKEYEAEQQRLKELHEEEEASALRVIELNNDGDILCVAKGGMFGYGNKRLKGSDRGKSGLNTKNPGEPGTARAIFLELKLIADVGLVGYPNAGKSSLLRALSNARPKVAPYPFTTLRPFMGVIEYSDSNNVSVADIPGIIEGAAENKGLGHDFLKHVVRTKMLMYVIDGAGGDGHVSAKSPLHELQALRTELELYDETLLLKPAMVFLNKMDLFEALGKEQQGKAAKQQRELIKYAAQHGLQVITGSAHLGSGMGELANHLRTVMEGVIKRNKASSASVEKEPRPRQKHAPSHHGSSR